MRRRTILTGVAGTLAGLTLAGTLAVTSTAATAISPVPPTITAKPHSVMVNMNTNVMGRNFVPGSTAQLVECSTTSWSVPLNPCDTNNTVTVTANKKGAFHTKFKVEGCPPPAATGPGGLSQRCYIGVPRPTGIDTVALQPNTSIVVTFP